MTRKVLFLLIVVSSFAMVAVGYKKLVLDSPKSEIAVPAVPIPEPIEPPAEAKPSTFDDALSAIDQQKLKEHVVYLAGDECEGRMSGKQGNVKAAEYIQKKLEDLGLSTMYDQFSIRKTNAGPNNEQGDKFTRNIYAWIEGTDPKLKDEIVVIGAHMDHIGYGPSFSRSPNERKIHPGADDNASGTAAVLELAKAFSMVKSQLKRTVVFQFYSGEEMGLMGSVHYCKTPKFPVSQPSMNKHVAMINLDMIGHLGEGVYSTSEMFESSFDLKQMVVELSAKYAFANQISNYGSRDGGSDHVPFYNQGVPVVFLHTGLHKYYHTPTDTMDTLNFQGMEQVSRFAMELAWKVSQYDAKIQFNYASFVELPIISDHGMNETPFQHEEE